MRGFVEEHRHERVRCAFSRAGFVSSSRAILSMRVCASVWAKGCPANFLYRRAGAQERSAIPLFAIRNREFQRAV